MTFSSCGGKSILDRFLIRLTLAQPTDLAFGNAAHAHSLHEVINRAGRDALHIGFLNHSRQRLLGHPARFQKRGEVTTLAQLRDTQLDRSGPGLPVSVTVSIALGKAQGRLLPMRRAGCCADLQFHQAFGRKADHLAEQIGIRGLLYKRAQVHHVVGHRWCLQLWVGVATKPYRKSPMTTRKVARSASSPDKRCAGNFANRQLHHAAGHDFFWGAGRRTRQKRTEIIPFTTTA